MWDHLIQNIVMFIQKQTNDWEINYKIILVQLKHVYSMSYCNLITILDNADILIQLYYHGHSAVINCCFSGLLSENKDVSMDMLQKAEE